MALIGVAMLYATFKMDRRQSRIEAASKVYFSKGSRAMERIENIERKVEYLYETFGMPMPMGGEPR